MVDNKVKSGVYFIYNPDTKLTKIGCSNNIKRRFNDLQKQSSHLGYNIKLELIDCIYCVDYFGLEKYLHKIFKKYRKINEWFNVSISDIKSIINSVDIEKYMNLRFNVLDGKTPRYRYINGEYILIGYVDIDKNIELISSLNANEKMTYCILRDLVQHTTNCVMVDDTIPSGKDLECIIGLSEKSILSTLSSLEDKNVLKRIQSGHRKAIYVNPRYFVVKKEIDMETLMLFDFS